MYRPTRQILPTHAPIVSSDEASKPGYLRRKLAFLDRNYVRLWEEAHAEKAQREQGNNVSQIKRKTQ